MPPLEEQRRIVDILNRADGIRRLRREALDKARQLIPALSSPHSATRRPIRRGGRSPVSARFYQPAIMVPAKKHRPSRRVCLYFEWETSRTRATFDSMTSNIELIEKDRVKYSIEEGDILFNRTNSKDLVGKTGLWDGRFEAVAASYFIRLRVDLRRASPNYVWTFLNSSFMKRRRFETARGAIGQSNINSEELRSFPIPLPPSPLQREFASRVTELQAAIVQQKRMADASEQLLAALMARLFDGG